MTKSCPTLGPTCRGCPDCQGIPLGIGVYETQAHADTDGARPFAKGPSFQAAATEMLIRACGPDDPTDFHERLARFVEEAIEAGYQGGLSATDLHAMVDYVTSKPREAGGRGQPFRIECGQAFFTLANLASFARFTLEAAGYEALRIADTPEKIARFRRKRSARAGRGALPGLDSQEGK